MTKKWKTLGSPVSEDVYNTMKDAAEKEGISLSAMVYALLHEKTNGFQVFNVPERLPRGFIIREKSNQMNLKEV